MNRGACIGWVVCAAWLAAACAQTGERASTRAPASHEAEEAPERPIATSLVHDPLNEPVAAPAGESQAHGGHGHQDHYGAHQPSSAPAPETGASAVIYTCPMHPEVQQAGPGECPKCGMRLVPKPAGTPPPPSSPQTEHAHEHAN